MFRLLSKFIFARFRVFPFQFFSKKSDNQCQNILAVRRYCILLYSGTHLDNYKPHVKYSIYDQQPFSLCINCINCINLIKDSKTLRSKRELCHFHLRFTPPQKKKTKKKNNNKKHTLRLESLIVRTRISDFTTKNTPRGRSHGFCPMTTQTV